MSPAIPSRHDYLPNRETCLRAGLAGLTVIAATLLATSSSASAAGACPRYSFDGYRTGGQSAFNSGIFGVSARIETNQPNLCGDDDASNGSSGPWAMVAARSKTDPSNFRALGYAQAGYQQTGSASGFYGMTGIYTFSQYTKKCKATLSCGTSADYITDFWTAPSGPTVYSAIQFEDGYIHMHADNHHIDQTGYSPTGVWESAWQGQFYGETTETASDQVGTAADPTSFDLMKKYDADGDSSFFVSVPPDTAYPSHYHSRSTAPASGGVGLKIWTQPTTRP